MGVWLMGVWMYLYACMYVCIVRDVHGRERFSFTDPVCVRLHVLMGAWVHGYVYGCMGVSVYEGIGYLAVWVSESPRVWSGHVGHGPEGRAASAVVLQVRNRTLPLILTLTLNPNPNTKS